MELSIEQRSLVGYVKKQLDVYLPDGYNIDNVILDTCVDRALQRCENCFSHIILPGYHSEAGEVLFSHLHMDQYATFLYFFGNSIWEKYQEKVLCDKLLNLNRILNGFFLSYKCPMPDIFCLAHPVGSVIGNAHYLNGLVILQNVTINTQVNGEGEYLLKIGKGAFFGAGAEIIGSGYIGDRCSIGAGALVYNPQIGNDRVCIRDKSGSTVIRQRINKKCQAELIFDLDFS